MKNKQSSEPTILKNGNNKRRVAFFKELQRIQRETQCITVLFYRKM